MANVVIPYHFRIRRDQAATWTAKNPVPLEGEWCLELDTGLLKLGDGSTAWNDLDYFDASKVPYLASSGGLDAETVQDAIDELHEEMLPEAPEDGGTYGRKNAEWVAVGGGGGGGWVQLGTYDHAVDGTTDKKDFTDLGDYQDFLVVGRGITTANNTDINLRVSVDNGSSFYASSTDYQLLSSSATETASSVLCSSGSATSSAKSPIMRITGNTGSSPPIGESLVSGSYRLFVASTSVINALRIGAGSGNMTGGKFVLYGR